MGATVYTRKSLRIYDLLVHGLSNRLIWRCPARKLIQHGQQYFSGNHLEIGIGSGKLFRKIAGNKEFERLVLADVNQDCLDFAQEVLGNHQPEIWRLNLIDDDDFSANQGFHSIGLNYVLHCLPISLEEKVELCRKLATQCLAEGGVLFGSTLFADLNANFLSKRLMNFYNRKGIFGNTDDHWSSFVELMKETGHDFVHQNIGCVCLFALSRKTA